MGYQNVSEIYPLYDTVIVSQRLIGSEANVRGWYGATDANHTARPWEEFAQKESHLFFKDRTEGNTDLAYCNLQSAETMDFGYRAYSIGVRFWGPISAFEVEPHYDTGGDPPPWGPITQDDPYMINSCMAQWWKGAAPQQCSFQFKVEQDVILEGPCMQFPPGHGFVGAGSSWSGPPTPEDNVEPAAPGDKLILQHPQMISVVNQGAPRIANRFNFISMRPEDMMELPQPVDIPKGALFEARVNLSNYVQYFLREIAGPLYYLFNRICPREWVITSVEPFTHKTSPAYWFGVRYGITVMLLGERLVQPRGQYWAPGAISPAESAGE